jgi:hypothetical protein
MIALLIIDAIFCCIILLMVLYNDFVAPVPFWCISLLGLFYTWFTPLSIIDQARRDMEKLIRRWRKIDHESGLPMAEWEERQLQKELDEKLTTGTYTDAEKEHLIYTAQLETEKKDELRKKHLPKNKRKPGI